LSREKAWKAAETVLSEGVRNLREEMTLKRSIKGQANRVDYSHREKRTRSRGIISKMFYPQPTAHDASKDEKRKNDAGAWGGPKGIAISGDLPHEE